MLIPDDASKAGLDNGMQGARVVGKGKQYDFDACVGDVSTQPEVCSSSYTELHVPPSTCS